MPQSPSLRRIQADIRELAINPSDRYTAAPLESDMLEWHFTIAGPPDSDFSGGLYHGRILLPPDYPFKPPNIVFLTKSGRFETNVKVCLSFSAFHPELWQPAWGIRLILEALIAFLPTPPDGAIGSLNYTPEERRKLAVQSVDFYCPVCQKRCQEMLKTTTAPKYCTMAAVPVDANQQQQQSIFAKEIEALKLFQQQEHANNNNTKQKDTEEVVLPASGVAESPVVTTIGPAVHPSNDSTLVHGVQQQQHLQTSTVAKHSSSSNNTSAKSRQEMKEETEPGPPETPAPVLVAPIPRVGPENTSTTTTTTTTATLQHSSTVLDPVLHTAMVLLSIIAILLLRKIQLLVVDLNELQQQQ